LWKHMIDDLLSLCMCMYGQGHTLPSDLEVKLA
jgi:hypothetical protein